MQRSLVVLSLLAFGFVASPSEAAPGTSTDAKAEAKAIAATGYQLYAEDRYDEAIIELEKAERIYHAPTLVFAIGQAHVKKGRLIEARALFRKVVDEKLAPASPKPFKQAQVRAKAELVALEPRIPTMTIRLTGAVERMSSITVSGAPLPSAEIGRPIERNPGSYPIVVTFAGSNNLSRIVDLKEGANEQVTIDVPAPVVVEPPEVKRPSTPAARAVVQPGARTETKPVPKVESKIAEPPRKGSLAPSFVAFGVGAAGLGVGVWAGAATLINAGLIKPYCEGNVCAPRTADMIARTKTLSVVSTVGFAVAGAGAATGVTLLVLRARRKAPTPIEVHAGPTTLEIVGVF